MEFADSAEVRKTGQAAAAAKPGTTLATNPVISIEYGHTGEEVIAAASGPGAEQVRGFFPNIRLFDMLMRAVEWDRSSR